MKKFLTTLALAIALPVAALAQGWPANYGGVMLQGFYWDSYVDTQWSHLQDQADELSQYFDLIWVPQSGNSNSTWNQMGYSPVYWFDQNSSFGTERQLRSMIQAFKAKGTGVIEDVVINHHNNMGVGGSWVDFPSETYNGQTYQLKSTDICKNDDGGATLTWANSNGVQLSNNNDTGEDWSGNRDLDHNSSNVQNLVKTYLNFLLNDLGYSGFRYDMVKGYSPSFTGMYNAAARPTYSVGEYWDGNVDAVQSWLNGTKVNGAIQSAAFDFPFRYTVRDAINGNNWTKLGGATLATNSAYNRYAVTFVENHDMEYRSESAQQDPIRKDTLAANAYLLSMPGTPCVFLKHWLAYKQEIKGMIDVRKAVGITNQSTSVAFYTNTNYYGRRVTGKNGYLLVMVGSRVNSTTPSTNTFVEVMNGYHYRLFMSKTNETPWADKASGTYESAIPVKLLAVSQTSGAQVVYTTNGTEPTASNGTRAASGTTVNIANSCTLKVGLLAGGQVTKVITRNYTIQPFKAHTATVYLKDPNWTTSPYFYSWDKDNKQLLGNWPGTAITDVKTINGVKFYYRTFNITSSDYYFNIIFDQGNGKDQTVDIGPITKDVYYEISDKVNGKLTVTDITDQFSGVSPVQLDAAQVVRTDYFDLQGRRLNGAPQQHGIFIERNTLSNGTVQAKKVMK